MRENRRSGLMSGDRKRALPPRLSSTLPTDIYRPAQSWTLQIVRPLKLMIESVRSATIAALARMSLGALFFGDPTPWRLGFEYIYPSLIIHLEFGVSVALTSGRYVASDRPSPAA